MARFKYRIANPSTLSIRNTEAIKKGELIIWYVRGTALERFNIKVNKNGSIPDYNPALGKCWLWMGKIRDDGYVTFHDENGVNAQVHRWAYMHFIGEIPKGLELDHLCRIRHCVNPSHLEAVTGRVNKLRGNTLAGINAKKTHCSRGHEFSEKNTYRYKNHRICRPCACIKSRRYSQKRKQLKTLSQEY